MNLYEWIQHEKNQEAYSKWLKDPVTIAMFDGLSSASFAAPLQNPTGEEALQRLGINAGRDLTTQRMKTLLDEVSYEESNIDVVRMNSLVADGYTMDQATKMLEDYESGDD